MDVRLYTAVNILIRERYRVRFNGNALYGHIGVSWLAAGWMLKAAAIMDQPKTGIHTLYQ